MLLAFLHGWFWHPLDQGAGSTCHAGNRTGCGYSAWSGVLGSFIVSLPAWTAAIFLFFRARNCHVHRCWRLSWHPHPEHGHPVCAVHHPDGHRGFFWRLFHGKRLAGAHKLAAAHHVYRHHESSA